MSLELFKSFKTAKGEMHLKHWQMLLLAIAFSWILWSIVNIPVYASLSGKSLILEILQDFAEQILETTVLLELSLIYIRLIVTAFWNKKQNLNNLVLQVLILTVLNCASAALMGFLYTRLYPNHEHIFTKIAFTDALNLSVLTSCYLVIFLINRYRDEADALLETERKLNEEENIRLRAELKNMSLQTDNHFVFNSLSTLSGLMATEPERAESFLQALSKAYRYLVQNGSKELVPLRSELAFVKEYVSLMQERYDGISVDLAENIFTVEGLVCPAAIQGLVENAIKHNRHGKDSELSIYIEEKNGRIFVSNNILPRDDMVPGTGSGLATLIDRYSLLTDDSVLVNNNRELFVVSLPILYLENLKYEGFDHRG